MLCHSNVITDHKFQYYYYDAQLKRFLGLNKMCLIFFRNRLLDELDFTYFKFEQAMIYIGEKKPRNYLMIKC